MRGYPFFYFYCAGMAKQNHLEQVPICLANNEVHRTERIRTLRKVTRVTDGGMLYGPLQLTLKMPQKTLYCLF